MAYSGKQSADYFSVDLLLRNDKDAFITASELLIRVASNILQDPRNPKYRKIRVNSQLVQTKLMPIEGGIECLFEMGFQEDGDFFTFPEKADLEDLKGIKQMLEQKCRMLQNTLSVPAAHETAQPQGPQKPSLPSLLVSEARFFKKLQSHLVQVQMYEAFSLRRLALSLIPQEKLQAEALHKQQMLSQEDGCHAPDLRDLLLLELLAWFKHDFFSWVNAPPCDHCQSQTHSIGMAEPTQEELLNGASRVEEYSCSACGTHTRFPRFNHPRKLLETRRGRCGEWANCFTLCCRALNFEARFVLDWTDHVWTEVYSDAQHRWLHCDPCENICDKPLMYEVGWNKKLSYVIAFSKDECVDVTWRYSKNHKAVLSRRTECRESWLVQALLKLSQKQQQVLSQERRQELQVRLVKELSELMREKGDVEDEEKIGRQSGSLAWRRARGETGTPEVSSKVITPSEAELRDGCIHLRYSSSKDCYKRGDSVLSGGWSILVHEAKNIARKEEMDWKMAYLARTEGSTQGFISWKFDASDAGYSFGEIEVNSLKTTVFEDGQVTWKVCSGDICIVVKPDSLPLVIDAFRCCDHLTITAELSQGRGSVSWQHTQLFRQKLQEEGAYSMDIKIHLIRGK